MNTKWKEHMVPFSKEYLQYSGIKNICVKYIYIHTHTYVHIYTLTHPHALIVITVQ